jgi:hypothetical protein
MAADKKVEAPGLMGWIDHRFPATKLFKEHMSITRQRISTFGTFLALWRFWFWLFRL